MNDKWIRGALAVALLCLFAGTTPAEEPAPDGAGADASELAVRGVVVPTGFQKGRYSALVQVAVDGSPLPGATWDLEASFVLPDDRSEDFSGRIAVDEPWTPAVLEILTTFRPGPYELALAAHENTAGQRGTGRLEGNWPDPTAVPATISTVAILQPVQAAFLRDGSSRNQGGIARADEEPVQMGLPTAIVCVVCRGPMQNDPLRVERRLSGQSSVDFETIVLQPGEEPCAQVRDLIGPDTMTEGFFKYELEVLSGGATVASSTRQFRVGDVASATPGGAR